MREELLQLQDLMVYGHTDTYFSYNNSVEMKGWFPGLHRENFKMDREHLCFLQSRENTSACKWSWSKKESFGL